LLPNFPNPAKREAQENHNRQFDNQNHDVVPVLQKPASFSRKALSNRFLRSRVTRRLCDPHSSWLIAGAQQ
jgi:hypothetical protein